MHNIWFVSATLNERYIVRVDTQVGVDIYSRDLDTVYVKKLPEYARTNM